MANNKVGFAYYSVDTDKYQDIKIKRLKKEFGSSGIAVYDYILCEIYRVKGCFLEWDESTAFDVADYFGLKETLVNEIVNYCCAVGLFDKELLANERVLTSRSIQSRFYEWSQKAKRKKIIIPERIKIIQEEIKIIPEQCFKTTEDCDKVKKSKVNIPSIPLPDSGINEEEDFNKLYPPNDGVKRNIEGIKRRIDALKATEQEKILILRKSNFGEINNPVWLLLDEVRDSNGKIKFPIKYILSKLIAKQ